MTTIDFNNIDFQTGDLILLSGNYFVSSIISYITHSNWTHIGIVIKDPNFLINTPPVKGIFMLEADIQNPNDPYVDLESGHYVRGVCLVNLEQRINSYKGGIAYRKLIWNKTKDEINEIFRIIYNTTYYKNYDLNPFDLLEPIIHHKYLILEKILCLDPRRTNKFFCSTLFAYAYTQLQLLKANTNWSDFYPKYFAEISELENNARLSDLLILKNR